MLAVWSGGHLAHWLADANTAISPLGLFGAVSYIQKPPETVHCVLQLCTSSAWRKVPGMPPHYQRSRPGRRWGCLQDGVAMGIQEWTWLPWEHPPAGPALHIHFCLSHTHEPQRFLPRCCCTGAPSSADFSYSDSPRRQNGYSQVRKLSLPGPACFPECKGVLHNIWKVRQKWTFRDVFVLFWYHWDAKGCSLCCLCHWEFVVWMDRHINNIAEKYRSTQWCTLSHQIQLGVKITFKVQNKHL